MLVVIQRGNQRLARAACAIAMGLALAGVAATSPAASGAGPRALAPGGSASSAPAGGASAAGASAAPDDATFLAAKAAFDRGDFATLDALAPALAGHPLALYVRFWQLDSRIDTAGDDAIRDYLARYRGTPPAETLRVDWLKSLAKRGRWDAFGAEWPPPGEPDVELQCDDIQYRMRSEGAAALEAAKPLWFTGASTPPACQPLFDALIERGAITPIDRRDRMRLAVAAGNLRLVRAIADALPAGSRITAREFAAVDRDPLRAVAKGQFNLKSRSGRELALYALDRASRRDAAAARAGWLRWRGRLDAADRDYGNLRVAVHGARDLDPRADAWFGDVRGDPAPQGSSDWRAWRVRAALRAGDWAGVARAITALPEDEKLLPAWRYWRARALAALGQAAKAQELYATFAGDVSYYGLLAADARGAGLAAITAAATPARAIDPAALAAFGARSDVGRMLQLARLDLRHASRREWRGVLRGLDDSGLLVASTYAKAAGLYDRAIDAADRTATSFDPALRYLVPWQPEFASAAREQGLDEALLYGIARQESRFAPDIVSSAGAVGLMQLMPRTAHWVARRLAFDGWSPDLISNVGINTRFGAYYFRYWQDRLDDLPALAAAAYNAGPGRARAWRPATGALEGAIWVETIPFNETRDYVKKVLANTMFYASVLGRPYVPLTQRLGIVSAPDSDRANLAVREP
jgi:soluble lytic murein transglycosylase